MTESRLLTSTAWLLGALMAAYACAAAVAQPGPVDRALPFLGAVITLVAAFSRPQIQVAVPLLIVSEISISDERTRLLAFGLILAFSFSAALIGGVMTRRRAAAITIGAILVLRWIPLAGVLVVRELLLIAFCLGIVAILRWTPWAVAIAVLTALFTVAIPLRTFALPVCVLLLSAAAAVAAAARTSKQRPPLQSLPAFVLAVPLLFFAWSGAFARSFPVLIRGPIRHGPRMNVRHALGPGQSLLLDVPPSARDLILSGANMSGLKKKTVVGRIDPGGIPVRIGDIADWGAFRREQFNASRNRLPRNPAGIVRDYGYSAWIDGGGEVPAFGTHMRVTANRGLPADARLQIEAFEMAAQ